MRGQPVDATSARKMAFALANDHDLRTLEQAAGRLENSGIMLKCSKYYIEDKLHAPEPLTGRKRISQLGECCFGPSRAVGSGDNQGQLRRPHLGVF